MNVERAPEVRSTIEHPEPPSSARAAVRDPAYSSGTAEGSAVPPTAAEDRTVESTHPDSVQQRVHEAVAAVAAGRAAVVFDETGRQGEGALVFAAVHATASLAAFTVRHTSGFVCAALSGEICDRLDLPPMCRGGGDRSRSAYRVTVDRCDTGTGIAASARAATIAALGSPASNAKDFTRPGHVVPLRADPDGVLGRPGRTEAAVDLARLAGRAPAAALSGIVSTEQPTEMAKGAQIERFAGAHGLALLSIADLVRYRRLTEPRIRRVTEARMPTGQGRFRAIGYASTTGGSEHLALVAGTPDPTVPVYVHTECVIGDVFGSASCGCRRALDDAMTRFAAEGRGVLIYLRAPAGARTCGLSGHTRDPAGTETADWILADLRVRPEPAVPKAQATEAGRPPSTPTTWTAA